MRVRTLVVAVALAILLLTVLLVEFRHRAGERKPTMAPSASSAPLSRLPRARSLPRLRGALPLHPPSAQTELDVAAPSITGRVLDEEQSRGIPGAVVTLLRDGQATSVAAGAGGSFVFEHLAPGRYELLGITAPGYEPLRSDLGGGPVELHASDRSRLRDLVFYLRAERPLEGMVLDPDGKPVSGAEVRDLDAERPAVFSDAEGRFRTTCRRGSILEAGRAGFATGSAICDREALIQRSIILRLARKHPTTVLAGSVVDAEGRPLSFAEVTVEPSWKGLPVGVKARPTWRRVTSGRDGHFVFDDLDAGSYDVTARVEDLAPGVVIAAAAGRRDVVVRLEPGASLSGLVRDQATQRPRPAFAIVLAPVLGPLERGPALVRSFFAVDGRFAFDALTPGDYSVTAVAAGAPPAPERRVTLASRGRADIVLELRAGGRLFGTVVDASSKAPLPEASVSFETELAASPTPLVESASTDERGRFELNGVGGEPFSLSINAASFHPRLLTGLRLGPDGSLGPLAVELEHTRPGEQPALELTGIGAILQAREDSLVVAEVIPGGGAATAGLRPGDGIIAVDGVTVLGLGFDGAIQRIRGPEGTRVTITLRRADETLSVEVPRLRVRAPASR